MFKLALFLIISCVISSMVSGDIQSTCSFCEQGTSCFIDVGEQCPPYSVAVDNSDLCACNAGFFMVDKKCVICTAGYYCPGRHTDASTRRRVLSETIHSETNYSGSDIESCPENSQSISGSDNASMCLCDSGYTALACPEPPCNPMCAACEAGTYKAVASNIIPCEACPADTYSVSLHECWQCPASTVSAPGSTAEASCIPLCVPGYTGAAGNCTVCDIGHYKNTSGSSPCTSCAEGHVSLYGEENCTACVPGKYGLPNSDACIMCEMGKYSNASAASSSATCQYCAAGQYGDVSNSVNGWDMCVDCPADSFSTPGAELGPGDLGPGDHMQAQCLPCPENMTSTAGSAACICREGFYGEFGSLLCHTCGENAFSFAGAHTSADCGCNAGYMREEEGLECVACRVGFFRAAGDVDEECSQCASGLSTLFNGSNSSDMCVACTAGSFVSENGECMLCPENAGSVTGGVCECDAGYSGELFTTTGVCSVCAKGFFKALHGNHACALCPAGTQGSGVQSPVHMNESCIDCAAGTFWLSEQTECQACVNNSFSEARAVGNCTCNAGYFASAGTCHACPAGTFRDLSSEECLPCTAAQYNPITAASACLACAPNSSTGVSNTAQSDCECDRGFTGASGGSCVLCELGSFKMERGSAACSNCSAGAYWPTDAQPTANHCLA